MTFQEAIDRDQLTLVDFHASWCGPCQQLAPVLKQLKSQHGDRLSILKIDVDKNGPAAAKFQVRSVPTLLLFRRGEQLWRGAGAMSEAQLSQVIAPHLD